MIKGLIVLVLAALSIVCTTDGSNYTTKNDLQFLGQPYEVVKKSFEDENRDISCRINDSGEPVIALEDSGYVTIMIFDLHSEEMYIKSLSIGPYLNSDDLVSRYAIVKELLEEKYGKGTPIGGSNIVWKETRTDNRDDVDIMLFSKYHLISIIWSYKVREKPQIQRQQEPTISNSKKA